MLRRSIHCDQLQRLIPLGNELMLRARGNNDYITLLDLLVFAINSRQSTT